MNEENKNDENKEEKIVDREDQIEASAESAKVELEPKTLGEELEKDAFEIEKGTEIIKNGGQEGMQTLEAHEANREELKEAAEGQGKITEKAEQAKDEYTKEIDTLKQGTAAETEVAGRCPKCGAETGATDKFCTSCGNKLAAEFGEGNNKIKENAERAKSEYDKKTSAIEKDPQTKEEAREAILIIREEMDKAIVRGDYELEKALSKERDRISDLFDIYGLRKEKNEDKKTAEGTGKGGKEFEKAAEDSFVKEENETVDEEKLSEKVNEAIIKLLKDPASELSILNKAANFEEDYIPKLKDQLEKTKASKIGKEERVKFSEKNIAEHEIVLEKHKKKIREIWKKIEDEQRSILKEANKPNIK